MLAGHSPQLAQYDGPDSEPGIAANELGVTG